MEIKQPIKILAILGISGSGKTYLAKNLAKDYSSICKRIVQVTTRVPREDEVHGEDYYFLTTEEYATKNLICKTEVNGNTYGTDISEFDSTKVNLVVVNSAGAIDLQRFIQTEGGDYLVKFVILHPKDNEPYATREDRDDHFIEAEWDDLNRLAVVLPKVYRLDNYNLSTGEYLTSTEALDGLRRVIEGYL